MSNSLNNNILENESTQISDYKFLNQKLWKPSLFIWLSIFFSFLSSGILFALNYKRTGKKSQGNLILIIIMIISIPYIAVVGYKYIPNGLYPALNIILSIIMWGLQKDIFNDHILNGGKKASFKPVVAVSVLCLAVVCTFFFLSSSSTYNYKYGTIFANKNVSSLYVESFGEKIINTDFLNNAPNKLSIQLDEKDGTYFVSLVCSEEDGTGTEAKRHFTELAEYFSETVFEGKPVKINVCSHPFRPYATYP